MCAAVVYRITAVAFWCAAAAHLCAVPAHIYATAAYFGLLGDFWDTGLLRSAWAGAWIDFSINLNQYPKFAISNIDQAMHKISILLPSLVMKFIWSIKPTIPLILNRSIDLVRYLMSNNYEINWSERSVCDQRSSLKKLLFLVIGPSGVHATREET